MKKCIWLAVLFTSVLHAQSSFNEVRDVLMDPNPVPTDATAQAEILVYQRGELPRYQVTTAGFFRNGINILRQASLRTINEKKDIYPRVEKLVHSNGICFTGEWRAINNSNYTGLFENGKTALMVLRVAPSMSGTRAGERRGFGITGKLFPTMDPDEKVNTANFFTVDVLLGTFRPRFLGVITTNNPPLGSFGLPLLNFVLTVRNAFSAADTNIMYRQVYEVSEAGLPPGSVAKTPRFIKIVANGPVVNEADFRDELNFAKHHPNGLTFDLFGSDTTNNPSSAIGWTKLSELVLKESVVSYGCDRQVHFAHPKFK